MEHYGNGNVKLKGEHLDGEMHGLWDSTARTAR